MDQLGLIGYCAVGAAGIQYGNGVHQWDVNVPDAIEFAKVCCHQATVRPDLDEGAGLRS